MADSAPRLRAGRGYNWRRAALVLALVCGVALLLDLAIGWQQERLLAARKAYKARLDRMALYGLRTGIDAIAYEPEARYRIRFRLQNALDEPMYVMMPSVEGAIQVRAGWGKIATEEPKGGALQGTVVKLIDEQQTVWLATIEERDYMQLFRGYIHLRLTLDAYVSPEENPREEIGERHEELFLHLRDRRLAEHAVLDARSATRPDFIPTRAWTLIPKAVR